MWPLYFLCSMYLLQQHYLFPSLSFPSPLLPALPSLPPSLNSQGDNCKFRHCSAALGSEETCSLWQGGKCQRKVCAFRHSQLDVSQPPALPHTTHPYHVTCFHSDNAQPYRATGRPSQLVASNHIARSFTASHAHLIWITVSV